MQQTLQGCCHMLLHCSYSRKYLGMILYHRVIHVCNRWVIDILVLVTSRCAEKTSLRYVHKHLATLGMNSIHVASVNRYAARLTSFYGHNFGCGMLPDRQLAISLAHRQQAAVWGDTQGQHGAWVLGGMRHLEHVQLIYLNITGQLFHVRRNECEDCQHTSGRIAQGQYVWSRPKDAAKVS